MINPDNFKSVSPAYVPRSDKPILSVAEKHMNLNPPLVRMLLDMLGNVEKTDSGARRIYVNLEFSRTDKAFRITAGTPETGFLFLTSNPNSNHGSDLLSAHRGTPSILRKMEVPMGRYVQKFFDQPDIFVLEVKPTKK